MTNIEVELEKTARGRVILLQTRTSVQSSEKIFILKINHFFFCHYY